MPEIFTKFSSHIVKHGMSFREQFTSLYSIGETLLTCIQFLLPSLPSRLSFYPIAANILHYVFSMRRSLRRELADEISIRQLKWNWMGRDEKGLAYNNITQCVDGNDTHIYMHIIADVLNQRRHKVLPFFYVDLKQAHQKAPKKCDSPTSAAM